jgi:serine phosphatase RsbU (regulator of sigma subunit)
MDSKYLKEQLQAKEDMLAQTTRFLIQIQQNLEERNRELDTVNRDIFDSINFASIIQKSLLPDVDILKIFFKDAAYKVNQQIGIGGDTVFVKNTNKGIVFGLLDSTGHGVPAALLSISGTLLLKELMTTLEINNPKIILDLLNYQLYQTFNKKESSIAHQEGIICSFSSELNKLTYASAKGKSFLIKNSGVLIQLQNSKLSIGENAFADFDFFEIDISIGDKLIMYSDGVTDQFGGEKFKKFSRERLKNILINGRLKSATELMMLIEEEFLSWKGINSQTDDVSFMVIEF